MRMSHRDREMHDVRRAVEHRWRKAWLAAHPGRTADEYALLLKDQASEVWDWRRAEGRASDKAMHDAWLREHPDEEPLPEDLCELDHPHPGSERWAAKAKRWLGAYQRGRS
jgi:hypothetical protein